MEYEEIVGWILIRSGQIRATFDDFLVCLKFEGFMIVHKQERWSLMAEHMVPSLFHVFSNFYPQELGEMIQFDQALFSYGWGVSPPTRNRILLLVSDFQKIRMDKSLGMND